MTAHRAGFRKVWPVTILAAGVVMLFAPLAAQAQIGTPVDIGSNQTDFTNSTSLAITTTQAVPVGASIIVIADATTIFGPQATGATCSDSAGNTYSTDVSQNGGTTDFSSICSTHGIASQLAAGSTVTVTWSGTSLNGQIFLMHAFSVTGLAGGPADQAASSAGTGSSASSGATATTTQANELLFGAFLDTSSTVSAAGFTPGTNGTSNPCASTGNSTYTSLGGVDSASNPPSLFSTYCAVSAVGAYAASATVVGNPFWQALVVTYKASARYVATTGSDTSNDCSVSGSPCATIGHAVSEASAGDTLNVAAGTYTENVDVSQSVTIQGSLTGSTIVNGGSTATVFTIDSGTTVTLNNLTITNGQASSTGYGGGIYNEGTLTVTNSTFSGNTGAEGGGGIYNDSGTLTVESSTFTANSTSNKGGAVYNNGGTLTVTNSTFSGNGASDGGGIFNSGTLTVNNCTVSGNVARVNGGGIYNSGTLTVGNSIVAGNTIIDNAGDDCYGCGTQSSYNLINTTSTSPAINPQLAGLGWYGGLTQTMLPLPGIAPAVGSPAICAGSPTLAAGISTDQRGFPRLNTTYTGYTPTSPACVDAGAVQTNYQSVQFAQSSYSGTVGVAVDTPAAPVVTVTENSQSIGGVPVMLAINLSPTVLGLGPMTTAASTGQGVASTGAEFSALTVTPAGDYVLSATLAIEGAYSLTAGAALDITPPAPTLTLSTPSLNFTTPQIVGTTSGDLTVMVTNTGTANLTFSSISTTSSFVVDLVNSTCSTSTPVPPTTGNTCIIAVQFSPATAGAIVGALVLADNATGSPHSVALSGTGIAPALGLSSPTITFGSQVVGTSSGAMTVTVSNTATSTLTFTSAPTASGDFSIDPATTTCFSVTTSLTTNTCAVGVIFTPTATGTRTGSLSIPTNAGAGAVGLTGTGTAPGVSLTPSSRIFGSQVVGTTSGALSVTLTNTGTSALTLSALAVTGDFSIDPSTTCSTSTPVPNTESNTCTIAVTFTPTVAGTRNGTVTVTDNANSVAGSMQTISLTGTGTAPGVSLTPSSRTFGSQVVGTTSGTLSVTLTNTGTSALTLSALTITGDFALDPSTTCSTSTPVPATESNTCTIAVTFSPTATGTRNGTVTIVDNANEIAGSMQTIALSGTGTAPGVSLTPSSLTFLSQSANTTSGALSATLTNTGTSALTLSSISISGDFAFAPSNTCFTTVTTVAASGGTCTISVTFTPTATGTRNGTVVVTDNANEIAGSTQVVALSGTGTESMVSFSAPSLSFGAVPLNTASLPLTETVTNNGTANLIFSPVAISGANADDFAISADTCSGATVIPTGTCLVSVTLTPSLAVHRSAALIFTDNNNGVAGSIQTVFLGGTGIAPLVSFSASSLTFAGQLVGSSSAVQTVTLINTGNNTLDIASIAASGDFSQTNTCAATLASEANCTISVTFKPTVGGARTGSITVTDNAAGSPHTVGLSGMGQDFTFSASSGVPTSVTVAPGVAAGFTISVGGLGGLNQLVTFACSGAPAGTVCNITPGSLTPGSGTTTVTVTIYTNAPSVIAPRSRPLPPVSPLPLGPQTLLMLLTVLAALAWAVRRRRESGLGPWRSALLPLAAGLLLMLALAACGGGVATVQSTSPGTAAGTYPITITGTVGSGSTAVSHSVMFTLIVS